MHLSVPAVMMEVRLLSHCYPIKSKPVALYSLKMLIHGGKKKEGNMDDMYHTGISTHTHIHLSITDTKKIA